MSLSGSDPALMYAQGGVARGGATRGGYTSPDVFVSLNGTQIAHARTTAMRLLMATLELTETLGGSPNTCRFDVVGGAPTVGGDLVMTIGSINRLERLFAGTVLAIAQEALVENPANVVYHLSGIDYTWQLNRRKVVAGYTVTAADLVAIDIVQRFTRGFTTHHVMPGLAQLDVTTFTNQDVTDALFGQLVKRIGGYGYIDGHRDLHLFVGDEPNQTNPRPLTRVHPTLGPNPSVTHDLSQLLTRVYVEGGGANALSDAAPGQTTLPVETTVWYVPTGGVVATSPQRITYTGVDAGGDGTIVGPGASPAVAPALTPQLGTAGVPSGAHSYGVAFQTVSGDSLVGPLATITVGPLPPPAGSPTAAVVAGADPGVTLGRHQYAVTLVSAAGETAPSALGPPVYVGPPDEVPHASMTSIAYAGAPYTVYAITFAYAFLYSDGTESDLSPVSNQLTTDGANCWQLDNIMTGPPNVVGRRIYQSLSPLDTSTYPPPSYKRHVDLTDNTTTSVRAVYGNPLGFIIYFATGGTNPVSTRKQWIQVLLSNLPTADPSLGITSRNIYRTTANTSQLAFLAHLYDNVTLTYTDTAPDSYLGPYPPTVGAIPANVIALSGIPVGPTGVVGRKVYRTAAGGSALKLLATIGDNTTTTYTDSAADSALGVAPPPGDTSGLPQPAGQILPGASSIVVAGPAAFRATGGWAVIGNGQQVIAYTGIAGSALVGIPASGLGAVLATISYNSSITAAPLLLGIPASGAGAIVWPIAKGSAINLLAQADNVPMQQQLAALMGGADDGIQDAYVQDNRLSYPEAVARASAELDLHDEIAIQITYVVRDPTTRAGATIAIDLGAPTNLTGNFKIQSVTRSAFQYPGVPHTCTVQASSTRFTLEDLLRLARAQQQVQGPV